jgi:hypothetical protein
MRRAFRPFRFGLPAGLLPFSAQGFTRGVQHLRKRQLPHPVARNLFREPGVDMAPGGCLGDPDGDRPAPRQGRGRHRQTTDELAT